jgi:hypothetical protein
LINIHFFLERSIQECTLDVHLMKLEVMMSSIGQRIRIDSSLATSA